MHELSLTESLIRIVETNALQNGCHKVKTIWLEIGALSNVEPEAMAFCFDAVAKGNPVTAGAKLVILPIAGQGYCLECHSSVTISQRHDPCPSCGAFMVQVVGGNEMKIKEMEVE